MHIEVTVYNKTILHLCFTRHVMHTHKYSGRLKVSRTASWCWKRWSPQGLQGKYFLALHAVQQQRHAPTPFAPYLKRIMGKL